jgi:hypothetical protein
VRTRVEVESRKKCAVALRGKAAWNGSQFRIISRLGSERENSGQKPGPFDFCSNLEAGD